MTSRSRRRLLQTTCASIATAGLMLTGALVAPVSAVAADLSPYDAVNMWIGTAKDTNQNKANDAYGNTFPGATLPFGMVQLSPTTAATGNTEGRNESGNWGGYMTSASDIYIKGFGMTRLSGTGCNDRLSGFDLPFLPYTGTLGTGGTLPSSPGTSGTEMYKYYNQFSHEDEEGSPGYYKVTVDADGVNQTGNNGDKNTTVELTATTRTGISKIDFPGAGNAAVLFNVSGANNNNGASRVDIDVANQTISGYATAKTVCNEGSYRIFFSTTFDQPFTAVSQWKDGAVSTLAGSNPVVESSVTATNSSRSQGADKTGVVLQFASGSNVEIRTGISYVSTANAALNRTTEAPTSKTFTNLRAEAKTTWENALSTIDVTGGTDKERTKFYTGLYHSLGHPNIYEDVNGQYRGYYSGSRDGRDWPTSGSEIKALAPGQEHEYVTYSSWDSLRGQMQLIAMLFPKVGSDMAASIANMGEQVGTWYNWPHLGSAQKKMEGDGMQVIVASLHAFGSDDFDVEAALNSMVNATSLGKPDYFRSNFRQYAGTGFIEDRWTPATSTTMDYAMADFAIAQLAQSIGNDEVHDQYMVRSHSWRNLVNQIPGANANRIVPRDRKGHWGSFDLNRRNNGSGAPDSGAQNRDQFDQSTGNQYQWYMTQNMAGVIDSLGGKDEAESYLDSLFNYPVLDRLDLSGSNSNGMYMSNQPSMHTPWVYNWLGNPAKATDVLDKARATMYHADAVDESVASPANPGFANSIAVGLPGNDDLGSLSSWFVWSSIGLYPAIFGRAELLVTSPAYDNVTITSKNLDGTTTGRTIEIDAAGQATNRYIQSAVVDGAASTKSYLPESFTQQGGTVELTMGGTPSAWGTGDDDVPPSFDDQRNAFNAVGTGEPGVANAGSLDVGGVTLPRDTLGNDSNRATPGATLSYDGIDYVWPASAPLQPDHWVPNGQEITIGKKASKVGFLGVATNGPSSGTAKVVYTDGTTVFAPMVFPDWTSGELTNERLIGSGRLSNTGVRDTSTWRIYESEVTELNPEKRVAKVILPTDVSSGLMHIFSVGTDAESVPQDDIALDQTDFSGGEPVVVSGTELTPGSAVTVSINTTPATTKSVTVDASGAFSLEVPLGAVPAGTYEVTATVTGDGGSSTFELGSITLSYDTSVSSTDRAETGSSHAFTGTGFAPTEAVTVTLGSQSVTVTAQADGSVSGNITTPSSIGAYEIRAVGAVSDVAASRYVAVVWPADSGVPGMVRPTVSTSASASAIQYGTSVTLTATVSDGATGRVVFLSGDELVGIVSISAGKATVSTVLPAGSHSIVAVYLGSTTHFAAESTGTSVSVAKVKAKNVKLLKAKKYQRGKAKTIRVKVAKLTNGQRAAGQVIVRVGKKKVATVNIGANKKQVKVKIPKKFTKKKRIKVRANFRPNDLTNITVTKSKVSTMKGR